MRRNGIDKLALLVVLGATAMVVLAAVGTGPAYSDDSRTDPAEVHRVSAVKTVKPSSADAAAATPQPQTTTDEPRGEAQEFDTDGYEWSGSKSADQRYLWSHRSS